MKHSSLLLLPLMAAACTVPDLQIEERSSVRAARDAAPAESDAAAEADSSAQETRDSGSDVRTGEGSTAGTAAQSDGGRSGSTAPSTAGRAASGGAGGSAGQAGSAQPSAAGMGGSAGAPAEPMQPTRTCVIWTSINIRNGPPTGAIEGGFETIAGVTTRQYICRFRPPGSSYAIPGKYVDRVGCYVTQRTDGAVNDASVLDGLVDVLVPAPGCIFNWRAATPTEIPAGAIDLGDPAGGRNFACRGEYANIGTNGMQIGAVVPSTDNPSLNQCWFESFASAIQPEDPAKFEVLVLDP